jgi:hypothetical protein
MARLAELAGNRLIWNLEKCEETAVAGAFVIISGRTSEEWTHAFSAKFFSQGLALSNHHYQALNRSLKRCGMDTLDIRESDPSDYARDFSDYDAKISFREEQRHLFTLASPHDRLQMLSRVTDEMARLLPPHQTWAEYKQIYGKGALRHAERVRRLAALENAHKDSPMRVPSKPSLTYDQATLLLRSTANPELISRIVDRLDTDVHMQIVAADDIPQDLKDTIIDRILAA